MAWVPQGPARQDFSRFSAVKRPIERDGRVWARPLLAKDIIEKHNGKIWFGRQFRFRIGKMRASGKQRRKSAEEMGRHYLYVRLPITLLEEF